MPGSMMDDGGGDVKDLTLQKLSVRAVYKHITYVTEPWEPRARVGKGEGLWEQTGLYQCVIDNNIS